MHVAMNLMHGQIRLLEQVLVLQVFAMILSWSVILFWHAFGLQVCIVDILCCWDVFVAQTSSRCVS